VINPSYLVVEQGKAIILNCNSKDMKVWYKKKERVSQGYLKVNNILITHAYNYHAGEYTCHGKLENGKKFTATATVHVAGKEVNITCFKVSCSIA